MCMVIVCVCDGDTEPWTKIRPTTLGRGNPAQRTGQYLGQGKRSPSNKPYLQRVTEWTIWYPHASARRHCRCHNLHTVRIKNTIHLLITPKRTRPCAVRPAGPCYLAPEK